MASSAGQKVSNHRPAADSDGFCLADMTTAEGSTAVVSAVLSALVRSDRYESPPRTADGTEVLEVTSRILCKRFQRVFVAVVVHPIKDTVKDPFAAIAGGEGAHGADAPAHFYKEPFNHVGSAQALPMHSGAIKECQQFLQVGLQTSDGPGSLSLPAAFPLSEQLNCLSPVVGLIEELGLLQAVSLGRFEFVLQVAQLVRPTPLVGHRWPEPANGFAQAGVPIGGDEFQKLSAQAAVPQVP